MQLPTFQPRFSLRGLFALVTLCAAGTWYWYQRPYPVEQKVESLWGVCLTGRRPTDLLPPKNFREVRYFRRVRGKQPVMHGPYRGYDLQGRLLRSGYYVNGSEHGEFIDYSPDGGRTTWKMVRGRREGETRSFDGKGNVRSVSYYVNGKSHGSSRSWDPEGGLYEEENHDMGVLHGDYYRREEPIGHTVRGEFQRDLPSGRWKWSLRGSAIVEVSGQFENGRACGSWEWISANGEKKLAAEFRNGNAIHVEPKGFSPRVLEKLLEFDRSYPIGLTYRIWSLQESGAHEPTLGELVIDVCYQLRVNPDSSGLNLAGLESAALRSEQNHDAILLLALYNELKPHGFSYDLRNDTFCIDRPESIAAWHDPTGVSDINPPLRSRLGEEWQKATFVDVVEMPFRDVIQYLGDSHSASFDLALLPQSTVGDGRTTVETPVTITIRGLSLKSVLAAILQTVHCRASLRGVTLVIEAQ